MLPRNLTAEMKSSGIKEILLTPVRDKEIDSIHASERRRKIIGLAAFLALLFLAGALAFWAFF
jgi:hypothetical protein